MVTPISVRHVRKLDAPTVRNLSQLSRSHSFNAHGSCDRNGDISEPTVRCASVAVSFFLVGRIHRRKRRTECTVKQLKTHVTLYKLPQS